MDLKPAGGIFWRLDASGNLTAYNTAGTILAVFDGARFTADLYVTGNSVTGGTTASTTFVSAGIGIANYTAIGLSTARIRCKGRVILQHSIANAQVEFAIYAKGGAGAVPATGTAVGADVQQSSTLCPFILGIAAVSSTFVFDKSIGIPVNNAQTLYLGVRTVTVGTITFDNRYMEAAIGV